MFAALLASGRDDRANLTALPSSTSNPGFYRGVEARKNKEETHPPQGP